MSYSPVPAGSVPFLRRTWNENWSSSFFHSPSLFSTRDTIKIVEPPRKARARIGLGALIRLAARALREVS